MKPQFIIDDKGNRTAVILPIEDYNKLIDELDESHVIRMYDKAKKERLIFRPFADALKEVNAKRAKRSISGSN